MEAELVELAVTAADRLPAAALAQIHRLFHASYRGADDAYLTQSLAALRFVATATAGDTLAGFAVGEMRVMDLPRLPRQAVALAGICCIDPRFRRRGLFRSLEQRAFVAAGIRDAPRVLSCGRVAHPASFRTITWNPTHVPKRGVPPTAWQREVGAAVACAYGVARFDPETFVCIGRGTPMAPVIDQDVQPEEWDAFATVDRSRGDSLLGLCWSPDAPEGW
jgi:hypothetical protein